ncbi:MAG: RNA polymerase sigma-70 factor [Bacteroidota bacterium]|nr:RNA polymerase sigma-70 factor [Bacteroidota bacterium]
MQNFDKLILKRLNEGDVSSFEILFKKYHQSLCIYAYRFTQDIDIAKEIVQNLFVYFWENRSSIEINTSLSAYLFKAVRNNSLREKASQSRFIALDAAFLKEEKIDEFYDSLEIEELEKQLLDNIDKLPRRCAIIFKMSRIDRLKYAEIAQKLNISIKTVESQMGKALRILRSKFEYILLILLLL